MKKAKDIVLAFYQSDAWKNPKTLKEFLHPDYLQYWHSPQGLVTYTYDSVVDHMKDLREKYASFGVIISHCVSEDDKVVLRYSVYSAPFDQPESQELHGHFIAIWEVKGDKLYRCYEVSAPPDSSLKSLQSFQAV